jgi:hypothetical protein
LVKLLGKLNSFYYLHVVTPNEDNSNDLIKKEKMWNDMISNGEEL